MFSNLARLFGVITATEKNNIVSITGLPTDAVLLALEHVHKSRKINKILFLNVHRSGFSIYSFFLVELEFMLKQIEHLNTTPWRVKRLCSKILKQLYINTWLKHTIDSTIPSMVDLGGLSTIKWTPKPHQMNFLVEYGEKVPKYDLKGYLLASAPGTGKTIMDLFLAACVVPKELAEIKIIMSPKNATDLVWAKTVSDVFTNYPTWWSSNKPGAAPTEGIEYYIFHYEALGRALDLAKALIQRGVLYFVIIDESHNFNEMVSLRTQQLVTLCSGVSDQTYSIWASGSPIKARGTELIPLLRSIDRKRFTPPVEQVFKKIFSNDSAAINEILNNRLGKLAFKAPASIVMSDKITPIRVDVTLKNAERYLTRTVKAEMQTYIVQRLEFYKKDMKQYREVFDHCVKLHQATLKTPQQMKLFQQYRTITEQLKNSSAKRVIHDPNALSFCKDYEKRYLLPSLHPKDQKTFRDVRSVVKTMVAKVRGEALGRILGKRRAECAADVAKHCGMPNIINSALSKTLVYSTYTSAIKEAAKYLEEQGYKTECIYGETNKNLTDTVNRFEKDPDFNPLCATYMSLSTAVPLVMANTIILLNSVPRDYLMAQVYARVQRLGKTLPTFVYEVYLQTDEPNISVSIGEILTWSRDQVAAIVGEDFVSANERDYLIESISEE